MQRIEVLEQEARERGAGEGPDGAADTDDGEQPLALVGRVDVVREAPEGGDQQVVEGSDPEIEREADRDVGPEERCEDEQVGRDEDEDDRDQLEPADAAGDGPVGTEDGDEEERLAGGSVGLHLGSTAQEDERLADDLQEVIRGQDEEDGRGEDEGGQCLTSPDLRERTQQAFRPSRRTRLGAHGIPF